MEDYSQKRWSDMMAHEREAAEAEKERLERELRATRTRHPLPEGTSAGGSRSVLTGSLRTSRVYLLKACASAYAVFSLLVCMLAFWWTWRHWDSGQCERTE